MIDLKKCLELTVMPTERCNFRCVYCYEDFVIGKMKLPVRNGIKNLISKRVERYGLDYLELSWFGGEPLLAKDVVFDIAAHAANLRQAGAISAMGGEMTTNGYLLDRDTLTTLVELQQKRYQITLDGDESEHNRTRRSASGVPTFESIWSNLLAAHESDLDFSIILRLHIMPGNAESLSRLVDRLIGTFEGDPRFSFFIREISNLGGPTSGTVAYISAQEARAIADQLVHRFAAHDMRAHNGVAAMFESQVDVHDISKTSDDSAAPPAPYICYAAKPYHFVIRPTGKIVKCTVDFNSDRNAVGELHADGTITLDSAKMEYWARGYKSGNTLELGCPAHAQKVKLPIAAEQSIPALLDEA
jgi:uncharacterized protein